MTTQIFLNGISIEDFQTQLIGKLKTELLSTTPQTTKEQEDEFLTAKQVSKLLGVSLVSLHKWKKEGKIKFHRFGTRIRFKRCEILNAEKFRRTAK